MIIDILELKRICEKYNKGPVDLKITFDYYCIKLDANFLGARVWRKAKAISYQLFESLGVGQFESLVDDFMDEFISDVKKQGELPCDSISDEVRAYPLHYEPTPFLLSTGLAKKIEEEVFGKEAPENKAKARWIDFGNFTNGKGFYCSNCGHRVYVLDGAYPSAKKCTNCKREME